MRELSSRRIPIRRQVIAYDEAIRYFRDNNQPDTLLLLKNRNDPKVPVHFCGDSMDLAHAPLVPDTGLLSVFEIAGYPPGFLLRYPPWNRPEAVGEFEENPVLVSIYREYKDWGKILGVTLRRAPQQPDRRAGRSGSSSRWPRRCTTRRSP